MMRYTSVLLVTMLLSGCDKPVTFEQAEAMPGGDASVKAYTILADKGDYRAQLRLGLNLLKDDPIKSAKYFKMASDAGDIDGMYFLGMDYLKGNGVPRNEPEGLKLLSAAANAGSVSAMEHLGSLYTERAQSTGDKAQGILAEKYLQDAFVRGDRGAATLLWSLYGQYPMANTYQAAVWRSVVSKLSGAADDPFGLLASEINANELIASAKWDAIRWRGRYNTEKRVSTFLNLNQHYD